MRVTLVKPEPVPENVTIEITKEEAKMLAAILVRGVHWASSRQLGTFAEELNMSLDKAGAKESGWFIDDEPYASEHEFPTWSFRD